jgi:hypothetical protein
LKFQRTWQIWPVNEAFRNYRTIVFSIAIFVPVIVLAGLGLFAKKSRVRELSPILLFGLGYTGLLMILVGTIRYRLPLEPFVIILSGAGASLLLQKTISSRSQSA